MRKLIILLAFPVLLIGCNMLTGEEIARLEINKVSKKGNIIDKEVILNLKKGDEIAFWSDMDFEYEGNITLEFKVKVYKNKTQIAEFQLNPTDKNITIGEVKTQIMGKTKWKFSGKNHKLLIDEDATYRISSILVSTTNPSLKINRAELVLKK